MHSETTGRGTPFAHYVNESHLFGRHGYTGLDWHARNLLTGVNIVGGNALEIGSGEGMISLWMLHNGARSVVSLEPEADGASHGVNAATERHGQALGIEPDRWICRAETFQSYVPDRSFRVIVSQNSINHLDEDACIHLLDDPAARRRYRRLFGKMAEMLEPGGQVVVADCARVNHWAWLGRHRPWATTIEWYKHQEPETWTAVLAEAGLEPASPVWWHPYYSVRNLAPLIGNRLAARWLYSYFVVRARKR